MARARCRFTVLDAAGAPLDGASVSVREQNTVNDIAATMYDDDTGAGTLANPLTTDSNGNILFYLAAPQRVDLCISKTGFATTTIPDQEVWQVSTHNHDNGAGGNPIKAIQTSAAPSALGEVEVTGDELKYWMATAAGVGTVVEIDSVQTMTNKTLTDPVIDGTVTTAATTITIDAKVETTTDLAVGDGLTVSGDTILEGLTVNVDLAVTGATELNGGCTVTGDNLNIADGNTVKLRDVVNIAHGVTDVIQTDVYGFTDKYNNDTGGLLIKGLTENVVGTFLGAIVTNVNTTRSTAGLAAIYLNADLKSGTSTTAMSANAGLFAVANNGAAQFFIDAEGDTFQNGTAGTAYDTEDDALALRDMSYALHKDPKENKKVTFYNIERLAALGLVNVGADGVPFTSTKKHNQLVRGAVGQLYERIVALEGEIRSLKGKVA